MKKLFTPFLLTFYLAIALSLPASAQDFEGIIYFEVSDMAGQDMNEMPYMVKGNKGRMEIRQGQQKTAMLMLPGESKMIVIIDQMQAYMEMNTDDVDQKEIDKIDETNATNTGETKTIAGKTCEVWQMESKEGDFEVCMAKGMGSFMMPQNQMQQQQTPAWAKKFQEERAMPLEVVELTNGKRTVKMKAKRIEEKSLSDDLFEVPEGYRDMSGMMKKMQNNN